MNAIADAAKRTGWLTRLRRDQSGNTVAMFAAAVFPLAGLIGGGLDMSRIYLTRTRLQAACDAGVLAGRKQMGTGTWAANSNKANTEATRMFNLNFAANSYGTTSTVPTFVENSGSVTGTASATIPMTLMRIFGTQDSTIDVSCNAAMSIPNTDIMFVLDTTGSMTRAPDGSVVTDPNLSKIAALRRVTKCFYETLAKIDITSVTPAECGETSNPSGGNAAGSQIRFGFVPYSSNVNVGKLLPNDFMVDSFQYQSRQAILTPVWVYTRGSENAPTYGAYNTVATPTTPTSSYVSYTTGSTSINVNVPSPSGPTYPSLRTPTDCSSAPAFAASTDPLTAPVDTLNSTSSAAPVHPGGSATTSTHPYRTYTRTQPQVRRFYRYFSTGSGGSRRCRLQYATANFDRTASGSSTQNIAWTLFTDTFTQWEYRPVTHNVSGLKAGGSNWNSTVALPTGFLPSQTYNVSGTNGVSYKRVVNTPVAWDGCIEERMTKRTNSWDPYPTETESPDLALKMAPSITNDDTRWKPSLNGGVWQRATGQSGTSLTGKTYGTVTSGTSLSPYVSYSCPSPSRLLTEYNSVAAAADFGTYLDNLVASGGTYHDIGMLWGARLVLPDGIFSANNAVGATNGIDRNIIYMTDGDTDSAEVSNTAYGFPWFDRRQNVDTAVGMTESDYDTVINSRFAAICDQLTNNENITVWVVSFGGTGISATTKARLKLCSTNGETEADGVHFFDATNTTELMTSFRAIASAISQLRLTN